MDLDVFPRVRGHMPARRSMPAPVTTEAVA
jgi:hypothetical protein